MIVPAIPLHALSNAELRQIAAELIRFNPIIRNWARAELARRGVDG